MENTNYKCPIATKHFVIASFVSGCLLFTSCDDGAPRIKDATETTVYVNTKGIEAIVNEVQPGDVFKISEENILDNKEDSRAIVNNLDNSIDTISMATMSAGDGNVRRSALRSTLMGGLAYAYFTGRAGTISPKASSYASNSAHSKSSSMTSNLKGAATSRKVSIAGKASKGYGSGKSFRSFGG